MVGPPLSSESVVVFGSQVGLLAHGRIVLITLSPSHSRVGNSGIPTRVPIYSGGTAPDFNRFPFYPVRDLKTGRPGGPPVIRVCSFTGTPCQDGKVSPVGSLVGSCGFNVLDVVLEAVFHAIFGFPAQQCLGPLGDHGLFRGTGRVSRNNLYLQFW